MREKAKIEKPLRSHTRIIKVIGTTDIVKFGQAQYIFGSIRLYLRKIVALVKTTGIRAILTMR